MRCVSLLAKSALMWLVLLVAMMGNGLARVGLFEPQLGEHAARQLASLSGGLIVLALCAPFVRRLGRRPSRSFLAIGAIWLALTVSFELLFGRYVAGHAWSVVLADYDVTAGRLWPLVLVVTLLAPWFWGKALGQTATRG